MPPQPHRPATLAWQVFRGSDAVRRGLLTRHQLRGASWIRLLHDVYADARLDRDHRLTCQAALLRLPPTAVIAGPSAAYLHGVEHAASFTDEVHVLVPREGRVGSHTGIRVHSADPVEAGPAPVPIGASPASATVGAGLRPVPVGLGRRPVPGRAAATATPDTTTATVSPTAATISPTTASPNPTTASVGPTAARAASGASGRGGRSTVIRPASGAGCRAGGGGPIPTSDPARAAWETAVWLEPVRAVGIVDTLLREGLTSRDALAVVADEHADRSGGRRARWVFDLADPGAQSPPESHLRVRLVLAGLPRPVAQHPVRLPGGLILHPDLAWPDYRVAVEYDGQWHADAEQLHRDRYRLNQLVAAGWLVLHVTSRRLHRDFLGVAREVRSALFARGWRHP
ncbi:hypothetical protein ACIBTV_01040 [Micromonospora sp. NPDC049366]|uniref:hypothetical protein n=1 Tax=Micromonospora sp. NPDC049366 TaxID=3364271 RepID=UPI0037993A19